MLDIRPELSLHYHNHKNDVNNTILQPVEKIVGTGNGWTKEVIGNVHINAVPGRTTLHLEGPGAIKIEGSLSIG